MGIRHLAREEDFILKDQLGPLDWPGRRTDTGSVTHPSGGRPGLCPWEEQQVWLQGVGEPVQ